MKITSLIPSSNQLEELELKKVSFRNLGEIVLLAGPNGSGKTRILSLVKNPQTSPKRNLAIEQENRARKIAQELRTQRGAMKLIDRHNAEASKNYEHSIDLLEKELDNLQRSSRFNKADSQTSWEPQDKALRVIDFIPTQFNLHDPNDYSKKQHNEKHRAVKSIKEENTINQLGEAAFSYIQHEQDRHWEVTHPNFRGDDKKKEQIIFSYNYLCEIIRTLVNAEVTRSEDGDALIFDKQLGKSHLSEGQKILLQLAVAIHPIPKEEDFILVLDEPENHLHPSAIIRIITHIRKALSNTQLWIATHSIPLISNLYNEHPSCLHYVNDGEVHFAGRNPALVLEGLLGNEEEREKLIKLTELPDKVAAAQFAAACLLPPDVISHQNSDPQTHQIHASLNTQKTSKKPLKVLDFGAGKGRLIAGLAEIAREITKEIDYYAYDKFEVSKEICSEQISEHFNTNEKRWFNSIDEILASEGGESFDYVILCNVLHEISPDDWLTLFGASGEIKKLINPNGYLLIVEDYRIPNGESPNSSGYFLLDTHHLQTLFKISTPEDRKRVIINTERNNRLKAHAIPVEFTERVNQETRLKAIKELHSTAVNEICKIRDGQVVSFQSGQLYGLWSQQLANCVIYLKRHSTEIP